VNQNVKVAIALGSNLGDRLKNLKWAVQTIGPEFLDDAKSSSVYESRPWGVGAQPDFLNAVVVGMSQWKPPSILNFLKALEKDCGRVKAERFGPRTLDLDLIAYGERVWESDGVTVPHPRVHERDFVLLPLCEVWPDWKHPVLQRTASQLRESLSKTGSLSAKVFAPPLLDKENR